MRSINPHAPTRGRLEYSNPILPLLGRQATSPFKAIMIYGRLNPFELLRQRKIHSYTIAERADNLHAFGQTQVNLRSGNETGLSKAEYPASAHLATSAGNIFMIVLKNPKYEKVDGMFAIIYASEEQ